MAFLLCDPGWYVHKSDVQNKWDDNTHTHTFDDFVGWAAHSQSSLCVCVLSSHLFWTSSSLDVPARVTQEEDHTGFLIHLTSAVRELIFRARKIQPFLSLVDREVESCVLTIQSFSTCWAFLFSFFIF